MRSIYNRRAADNLLYWKNAGRKDILRKIGALLEDIQRNPYSGLGHPEPLRHELSGWWSRRITREHRLVYKIEGDTIIVAQCRFHY